MAYLEAASRDERNVLQALDAHRVRRARQHTMAEATVLSDTTRPHVPIAASQQRVLIPCRDLEDSQTNREANDTGWPSDIGARFSTEAEVKKPARRIARGLVVHLVVARPLLVTTPCPDLPIVLHAHRMARVCCNGDCWAISAFLSKPKRGKQTPSTA